MKVQGYEVEEEKLERDHCGARTLSPRTTLTKLGQCCLAKGGHKKRFGLVYAQFSLVGGPPRYLSHNTQIGVHLMSRGQATLSINIPGQFPLEIIALVHIHEIWVLLVRHVPKGSGILRESIHFSTLSQDFPFPFLGTILPDVHISQ